MHLIDVGCGWAARDVPLRHLRPHRHRADTLTDQKGYAEERIARAAPTRKIVLSHWEDYTPPER